MTPPPSRPGGGGRLRSLPVLGSSREPVDPKVEAARWIAQVRLGVVPWHGCNLRCKHCYVGDSKSAPGMETADFLAILRHAEGLGIAQLDVSGGEVFDWPRIDEVLGALAASPLSINIATNGSLIEPRQMEQLAAGRVVLCLSLAGPEPIHDALRGRDAYAATARAATLSVEHGMTFELSSTVTKQSLTHVADTIACALELGATSIRFSPLQLLGGRSGGIAEEALDDEDCIELLTRLTQYSRDLTGKLEVLAANMGMRVAATTNPCSVFACWGEFCPSPKYWPSRLFVMPDGEVLPQSQHVHRRYSLGNIAKHGLGALIEPYWEGERHHAFQRLSRHIYQDRIHDSERPFYFWDELAHEASAIPTEQLPERHTVSHPHDHTEEIERLRERIGDVIFPLPIG